MLGIDTYGKSILIGLMAICSIAQGPVVDDTTDVIRVRISSVENKINVGEKLLLHVEVRNVGPKPVFIPKELGIGCEMGKLTLSFLKGPLPIEIDSTPGVGTCHEFLYSYVNKRPPLAVPLAQDWIALAPGQFFGRDVETYSWDKPAKIKIAAEYSVQDYFKDLAFAYPDDIKELPYKNWKGQVAANSFEVEVVERRTKKP